MSKYYAVKEGFTPGIYTDWNSAKKQVDKYKGAIYKGFKTEKEALQFMKMGKELFNIITVPDDVDILVYTDGSCINQIGGFGICVIDNPNTKVELNTVKEYKGHVPYDKCTNNIAELYAIYQALIILLPNNNKKITIRSDSNNSIQAITINIHKWKKNNFMTTNNEPVKNADLIIKISNLLQYFDNLKFIHVFGHQKEYYNEKVDKLANEGRLLKID